MLLSVESTLSLRAIKLDFRYTRTLPVDMKVLVSVDLNDSPFRTRPLLVLLNDLKEKERTLLANDADLKGKIKKENVLNDLKDTE